MINLKITDIATAVKGEIVCGPKDGMVDKISLDTRTLEQGSLFIPLRGERFDGHDFLAQAARKGARVMIVDREGDYGYRYVSVIRVKDTLEALHLLARWYRTRFEADFVAVTGSTGKTTTKNIIATVLEAKYNVLKTPGNYNNQIGLPATIMSLDVSHRAGVIEMGMSGYGEIENLMKIVKPKVSVITNIGMSHIERLGSREGVLRAKMEVFSGMAKDPTAVINADDPLLRSGSKGLDIPVVYYGIKEGDYKAENVLSRGEEGTSYTLLAEGGRFEVVLPLPGRHNVYNSLAAVVVGRLFSMEFEEIIRALRGLEGERMRLTIHSTPGGISVINDAYNASPDSMKSALEVLSDMPGERKIAVLADMLEMGTFSEEGHRLVGQYAAYAGLDVLITVGDKSRFIALEAEERGMDPRRVYCFENKGQAAEFLYDFIKEGDVILVKGSRRTRMEELAGRILERS
ncbi:MAG: UDP-N-acetylmuramoyl-tripeptide--D-alanyl-D-alanine ligase [Bacillota bacterium]|nr:UDP-N-acetylmuramoyl-tripeptide--D-alanyl-D-alanine ligase [Bacillota bacterium]MDD3297548.1 UDP-N-acetylmuramoyl-tripeptide--D-alanyl-D-alanine ligase [Bacillota bacterium]MDD3850204.1 UDP-N-acetylmuramoyl-tripeptide--D-alanyl-D-alanine ligase [Bacillota bacterium]MDD4707253.1 UDP-N-acetylmuramoyl-tripeptide--D-alanyl-D-alanine ligase [Bacillota bacterium]